MASMDTSQRVQLSNAQQRKRSWSVFEEGSTLAVPSIIQRDKMSLPDGHPTESEPSSEVLPSNDTSPPSTASIPSLGMAEPYSILAPDSPALAIALFESIDWARKEAATQSLGDAVFGRINPTTLGSIRERRTGSPTTAPPDKYGFHHTQCPDDTLANTGTYTCEYHSCTQRFESQPALQRHKRDFHRSQEHDDSGAELGTASVSPRPHARPVLISDHTPVSHVQPPKHRFTICRSQESQLGDLRMRYPWRELSTIHVIVAGCWGSVGSLLSDLTENVRFEYYRPGPGSVSLWGAIAKATAPETVREMFDWHLSHFPVDGRVSQWMVDLEWTKEGITGHWQDFGKTDLKALKWTGGTAKGITVFMYL